MNCTYSRISTEISTVWKCLIYEYSDLGVRNISEVRDTCWVLNVVDYFDSQIYDNVHDLVRNPFDPEIKRWSISSSEFRDARLYLASLASNKALMKDTSLRDAYTKCIRAFLAETATLQIIFSQELRASESECVPGSAGYPALLPTLPHKLISNLNIPVVSDVRDILASQDQCILTDSFEPVYEYIKANVPKKELLSILSSYGPEILRTVDFNQLHSIMYTTEEPYLRQALAQLWLASQKIYCFGGAYDASVNPA